MKRDGSAERLYDNAHHEAMAGLQVSGGAWRFEVDFRDGEMELVRLSEEEWQHSEEALARRLDEERKERLKRRAERLEAYKLL